jgi:hypothetical protein
MGENLDSEEERKLYKNTKRHKGRNNERGKGGKKRKK